MGIVTYLPRMMPATVLSRKQLPELLIRFLNYIPAAVLSALFFPSVLVTGHEINIGMSNPLFITSLLTFPIAYKTKNMFLTVIIGMIIIIILNNLIYQ
jgi:branched-subunit amino acid transport protein